MHYLKKYLLVKRLISLKNKEIIKNGLIDKINYYNYLSFGKLILWVIFNFIKNVFFLNHKHVFFFTWYVFR